MLWDKIQGQAGAVNYLRQSIRKDKVVSGYLFQGPSGVGKTLAASIFPGRLTAGWHREKDAVPVRIAGRLRMERIRIFIFLVSEQ